MLGNAKPTASLSSGLLARKGQARPAMRPQGFHGHAVNLDDLGWNDMGDEPASPPAAVIAISPAAAPIAPQASIVPPVLVERETLREEIEEPEIEDADVAEPEVAEVVEAPAPMPAAAVAWIACEIGAAKAKAAFTLRLDADRHLRLRLASASRNLSSQALVVAALDAFIATLPEVEGLACQLSANRTSRGK